MKYKVFGVFMAVLMLACALAATAVEAEEGTHRVHQHLDARQPNAGCDCNGSELCTHLPLVMIDTGGTEIPGIPLGMMRTVRLYIPPRTTVTVCFRSVFPFWMTRRAIIIPQINRIWKVRL